jgi:2-oxoglutarate ferredoxin oxidoreductase subunit beta
MATVTTDKEKQKSDVILQYLRPHKSMPTVWCAGCGNGIVMTAIIRAVDNLGLSKDGVVMVSGIGCSSRMPIYLDFNALHTTHGRALGFATGVKFARPELKVIVITGDGDALAIGGNHFIHACRRNVDMLYVVMDNRVYGMTKGQPSPTTEPDWDSDIAPGGIGLRPFNPLAVAIASGANYVARGFSGDPNGLADLILDGIRWPGFAFIEVLSPCVTFRPEQTGWKKLVRPSTLSIEQDRAAATALVLGDDGFSLGLLYRGDRAPVAPAVKPQISVADVEREFALRA